jgi:hypothetical protein
LPQLRQLRQRIMLRCKTTPLTKEQIASYISERLKIAGSSGAEIFSAKAVETIHMYSLGIPRVVNLLCEHALVNAFAENQRVIDARIIEEVAKEFQLGEVELMPTTDNHGLEGDVYDSGIFLQNLGEVLKNFRVGPQPLKLANPRRK